MYLAVKNEEKYNKDALLTSVISLKCLCGVFGCFGAVPVDCIFLLSSIYLHNLMLYKVGCSCFKARQIH